MRKMVIETGERADGRAGRRDSPAVHPSRLPAARARLRPVPARPDPGALRVHPRHAERVRSAWTPSTRSRATALHAPVQLPAVLHRRGGPHGRSRSAARSATAPWPSALCCPCCPTEDEFPYAIRVVSEVLESNGSSSMASTCGSTPVAHGRRRAHQARPVAGIAMGLIKEGDDVVVLTDIQGHRGLPGRHGLQGAPAPREGITAAADGQQGQGPLDWRFWRRALKQAQRRPRTSSWTPCSSRFPAPREELRDTAPRIETIHIPVDKIREVIGSGGKTIRGIQDETGASIDIQEDGTVHIAAVDQDAGRASARQGHRSWPS